MKTTHFCFAQSQATGYQIELLIRQYGIPVHNRHADDKLITFDVPQARAKWAAYIFRQAGLLPPQGNEAGVLPTAWGVGVRRDLMALWVDFLAAILGAPLRDKWRARTRKKGRRR